MAQTGRNTRQVTWASTQVLLVLALCSSVSSEMKSITGTSVPLRHTGAESIGSGDGLIHIIPSLSAPSVKNGQKLSVQAVVKAQADVAKVVAIVERETPAVPDFSLRGQLGLPATKLTKSCTTPDTIFAVTVRAV